MSNTPVIRIGDVETPHILDTLLATQAEAPRVDDVVEGVITSIGRAAVYVDLSPFGTGIIYGREFMNARDVLRKAALGDKIEAKIVSVNAHPDGYIELSLKEARQAIVWSDAERLMKEATVINLEVKDANKGGLLLEWQGISGFLPASQLSAEHYPRVEDGDKDKISTELRKLMGQFLSVVIIAADPRENKLIFSEKSTRTKQRATTGERATAFQVGDILTGEVTGVVDFGVFVKLDEGVEGLVHISELDWGLVEDTRARYKIGDVIRVKVIDVKSNKISLSIKQLRQNPWETVTQKYHKGDTVQGVVIRHNQHGALVSIEEGIAGLVHISEFGDEATLRNTLTLGQTFPFQITLFIPKEQRMTLSFKAAQK